MAGVMVGGSWEIDDAVARHWAERGLEEAFRQYWLPDPGNDDTYEALNFDMANPVPKGPYCVFLKPDDITQLEWHSGSTYRQGWHQMQSRDLEFRLYAKDQQVCNEKGETVIVPGYTIAKFLAIAIATAFKPGTRLCMSKMLFYQMDPLGDFAHKFEGNQWSWSLFYQLITDVEHMGATIQP